MKASCSNPSTAVAKPATSMHMIEPGHLKNGAARVTRPLANHGQKIELLCRSTHKVSDTRIWVEIHGTASHVHSITINEASGPLARKKEHRPITKLGKRAQQALLAYFQDPAQRLDLPLWRHADSSNQAAAMDFLKSIPCGSTRSYSEQAVAVRRRCANGFNARNAGNANRNNHYPLAIPCHRVVRSDGDVGGFMGSTRNGARSLKQALLDHESKRACTKPNKALA